MYNKTPAYFLNEIATAEIETHERWGKHNWTATLCEYFGQFFIIKISYSQADKVDLPDAHSWDDAQKAFERYTQMNKVVA